MNNSDVKKTWASTYGNRYGWFAWFRTVSRGGRVKLTQGVDFPPDCRADTFAAMARDRARKAKVGISVSVWREDGVTGVIISQKGVGHDKRRKT